MHCYAGGWGWGAEETAILPPPPHPLEAYGETEARVREELSHRVRPVEKRKRQQNSKKNAVYTVRERCANEGCPLWWVLYLVSTWCSNGRRMQVYSTVHHMSMLRDSREKKQ